MSVLRVLKLLCCALLPNSLLALNSLHGLSVARHRQATHSRAGRVSPIAGCAGFDCVLQYLALADDAYEWRDTQARLHGRTGSSKHGLANVSWTGYVLNMTSQRWNTPARVDHPIWWHSLVVIVPEVVEFPDWATLVLDFGINWANGSVTFVNNRPVKDPDDGDLQVWIDSTNLADHLDDLKRAAYNAAYLAARTRAPAASLLNLPNEGEIFGDDPVQKDRAQDYLKAFTYQGFLDHPDEPERIVELPVAKAAVRAMDTVQAFTATLATGAVKRFGVTGYSKLGTATYVVAAADSRVKAIVPGAIYLTLGHMQVRPDSSIVNELLRALRKATYAHEPLSMEMAYAGVIMSEPTPEFETLTAIIDPLKWKERLALPKLVMWGSSDTVVGSWSSLVGDQLKSLPGITAFSEVPNCVHDDTLVKSLGTASAFFRGFLLGLPPPSVSTTWDPALRTISLTRVDEADAHPLAWRRWEWQGQMVGLGQDIPYLVRDFTSVALDAPIGASSTWSWTVPAPSFGHPASSFIELEFEWPEPGFRYKVTSSEH